MVSPTPTEDWSYRAASKQLLFLIPITTFFGLAALWLIAFALVEAAGLEHDGGLNFVWILGAAALLYVLEVTVKCTRMKVAWQQKDQLVRVFNPFRDGELEASEITGFDVKRRGLLFGLGAERIPVAVIEVARKPGSSRSRQVPIYASFSAGKDCEQHDALMRLAEHLNVPCRLGKLHY